MFTYNVENTVALLTISVKFVTKTLSAANSVLQEHLERTVPVS